MSPNPTEEENDQQLYNSILLQALFAWLFIKLCWKITTIHRWENQGRGKAEVHLLSHKSVSSWSPKHSSDSMLRSKLLNEGNFFGKLGKDV